MLAGNTAVLNNDSSVRNNSEDNIEDIIILYMLWIELNKEEALQLCENKIKVNTTEVKNTSQTII